MSTPDVIYPERNQTEQLNNLELWFPELRAGRLGLHFLTCAGLGENHNTETVKYYSWLIAARGFHG